MRSDVDLVQAEYFAGLLFTDEDLSHIFELDLSELRIEVTAGTTPLAKAINRGRLLRQARLRQAELTMAEAGSSPALSAAKALVDRMRNA